MDENRTSCTSSPDYLTTYFDYDNYTGNYSNYSDFGVEMCEPDKRQELTIMAVFLIAFFLGLIGNSLVIATFAKYHRLRLRCMTDVFLFYLAIFNLLLLLTLPLELSETFNGSVKMWTRVAMITGFFVPCVAMLVCYSTIGRVLMQGRGKCFRRQKTLRLIVALILLFLLFQLPYAMVLTFRLYISNYSCKMWSDIHLAEDITHNLVYAHCCFNPMLYALLGVRFRSDVMRLLHDCGCICSCLSHITPNLNYGSSMSASSPPPTSTIMPFSEVYSPKIIPDNTKIENPDGNPGDIVCSTYTCQ